jgi:hypothetical protein
VSDEILRLRDRVHRVEGDVRGLAIHVREFEEWRRRIDPVVAEMREADRIADAVAQRMTQDRARMFTDAQVWAGIAAAGVAAVALVCQVLSSVGVL